MGRAISESADQDIEARQGIWNSVCRAAEDVRTRFDIAFIEGYRGSPLGPNTDISMLSTWQLMESLSLLCVILRSTGAKADRLCLFGKCGPVQLVEDGVERYLWAQKNMSGQSTALCGRPDIVVTSSAKPPNSKNVLRIVEAKCVRKMGIPTIRGEFGKAHDLRVATYLIWSFYTPSLKVVAGARALGIDLHPLGLDSTERGVLLANPDVLISHVAHTQEQARLKAHFAQALENAGQDAKSKLRTTEIEAVDETDPPSELAIGRRLLALAKFKDDFGAPGFLAGERIETGDERSFSYMTYAPSVDAFVDAAYKYKWVRYDFDWMRWLDEVRFEEVASPERIAKAGVEDLERLMTVIVRQERFAEGSLSVMFEDGVVQAIVERAGVLSRKLEG